MNYGLHIRLTGEGLDIRELAALAEERGFESLWVPEHSHVPVSVVDRLGLSETLDAQRRLLDPFVVLAAAAAVTKRIRLGTGVCLLPVRDPILLAKEVASLDVLSGGRLLLGVGIGSHAEEIANHGVDPSSRWAPALERLAVARAIWAEEVASFSGAFQRIEPLYEWPKPVQRPHPPILIGGHGRAAHARTVAHADEWFPHDHPDLDEEVAALRELALSNGRPDVRVSVFAASPEPDALERYARLGVHRVVFQLPVGSAGTERAALEELAHLLT